MSHGYKARFAEDVMSRFGTHVGLLWATLACIGPLSSARADTIVHKDISYFSIGGTTAADLDREMLQNGPLSTVTGRRHPGITRIKFAGTATFVAKGSRCWIGGAKVTLTTKILLPRWSNRGKAAPSMALIWDTLSADIRRHEERHAEIARYHARDLEKRILALPPASDCPTLKAKVAAVSQQALEEHDKDQRRFDRIEAANFESRMIRLLRYRITARKP
jgi:predicted secreted Zn-dependent protease